MTVLLFFDSRILLRILLGEGIAEVIGFLLGAVFIIISLLIINRNWSIGSGYTLLIALFCFITIARFFVAGINWKVCTFMILPFLAAIVSVSTANNLKLYKLIINAILIVILANACVIIFPIDFITQGLEQQTDALRSAWTLTSLVGSRAIGLFSAPGFLSLYASISFGIGITLFYYKRSLMGLVLLLSGLFCGISSGNRSFILGVAVAISCLLIISVRDKTMSFLSMLKGLFILVALFGIAFLVISKTEYLETIDLRFSQDVISRDVDTRMYGEFGMISGLNALLDEPLWGALAISPDGRVGAFDGMYYVQPHNAIVEVLATRGLLMGLIYILFCVNSIRGLYRFLPVCPSEAHHNIAGLFVGLVTGLSIAMIEPLGEISLMLVLIGLGLGLQAKSKRRAGSSLLSMTRAR
jgi:hypothetical protein